MKPGNRLVIEMVPIHIKLITLEDERKMNQCFLNFAKVRKHFNYIMIFKEALNVIELNQVVKRYHTKDKDVLAVDNVNLNIETGSIFGVIGFSGAGKSTLIRMFNNLEEPTSGDIIIDGDNINKLSKAELRRKRQKVSMVFQHFNLLWSRTVLRNITFL